MSDSRHLPLSRRSFMRQIGIGIAALATSQLPGTARASEALTTDTDAWGMLIDLTRCVGCNSCALACKKSNNLSGDGNAPSGLDSRTYTFVDPRQASPGDASRTTRYVKRQCMHCVEAACVAACPAAAMYRSDQGPIIYRAERCLGCRYCQVACPFDIPRFEWNNGVTPRITKCWLCYERLQDGQLPACVEACPCGALRFGYRRELLAQAHGRIDSNPGRYLDHVLGEWEVGGTSVLYLSDVAFELLGFPSGLPRTAPPQETEKIMQTLPFVIPGVALLMIGSAVQSRRRVSGDATHQTPADPALDRQEI